MAGFAEGRLRLGMLVAVWRRLLTPFGISLLYLAVGTAWILYSDDIVAAIPDRAVAAQAQLAKGVLFVAMTAILLLVLITRLQRDIVRSAHDREHQREARGQLAATLAHLTSGPTPEATAAAICGALRSLPGIEAAAMLSVENGSGTVLAIEGDARQVPAAGSPIPKSLLRELRERSRTGAWRWQADDPHSALAAWLGAEVRALIGVPILDDGQPRAALLAFTASPSRLPAVANQLPSAVDLAEVAGALLIPPLREREAAGKRRDEIASIVDRRQFSAVFQPIVELRTGRVVGYEALTRFADNTPAKDRFAQADALGLSVELEGACLRAALAEAGVLPRRAWLSLNVSPALLLDERLPALVRDVDRPIVLELTEHQPVSDYGAVREALKVIGRGIRLAVDDAGAGFASLRHLAELRPAIVKLDRDLIAGVARDGARQALIAGLRHYAERSHCALVAEGIETDAERHAVEGLGVRLGQGYLFGAPSTTGASLARPMCHAPPARVGRSRTRRQGRATGGLTA